jgi:hypothetical protein
MSETALQTLLSSDPAVAALAGTRVASDRMEQGQPFPFVIFTRTGTEPLQDISGAILGSKTFFEVQAWGSTRASAEALADACQTALRGAGRQVVNRSAVYDQDVDAEGAILSVEWWA